MKRPYVVELCAFVSLGGFVGRSSGFRFFLGFF
jgi:hypothetical protein